MSTICPLYASDPCPEHVLLKASLVPLKITTVAEKKIDTKGVKNNEIFNKKYIYEFGSMKNISINPGRVK